jgi:hypothetical protein
MIIVANPAALYRESRAPMAAWTWSGDPEPYLPAIPTEAALTKPTR